MAIIKEDGKTIYRSVDKKTDIIYEVSTNKCWIAEMTIIDGSERKTIPMANIDYSPNIKEDLMKFYTNLPKKEFIEFIDTIDMRVIEKFTKVIFAYVGGQNDENYRCYMDYYGNLIMITNYAYHYLHGCSSTYEYIEGDSSFKRNLKEFCKHIFKNHDVYQKFVGSLNKKMLSDYFEKSYIVKN